MSVKLRKVENSNMLTVPSHIQPIAEEYDVFQGRDGAIVYTPKQQNPFHDKSFVDTHDFTQEEFGGTLIGEETPKD